MAAQAGASHKQELFAMTGGSSLRWIALVLCLCALASAAVVYWTVQDIALAGGFAAAIIGLGALVWLYGRMVRPVSSAIESVTDWSVARSAANLAQLAIAVTDRSGKLVCASDLYGEWFPNFPLPSALSFEQEGAEALAQAGRDAWRDGEAKCDMLIRGALTLDARITRTGRHDDYLLWHFAPVRQVSALDDMSRIIGSASGRQLGEAGIMAVVIGGEGRLRVANPAFVIRATGRTDADVTGRDFAAYFRRDGEGRIFLERESSSLVPLSLYRVLLKDDEADGPALIMMVDQVEGASTSSSLSYVEALLGLLPVGLAMTDRDGRILYCNDSFLRASGAAAGAMPTYPGDLVVTEDQAALAAAVRRYAVGPQTKGDIAVRLRSQSDEPVSMTIAGIRGLGQAAVLLSLKDNSEESTLKRQVAQATKMQAVGQLAGGVAHDFNNILTAIIGYCDLILMRHTPGDSDYDDIQQIKSNSNRAASLTRQLLAFSRQQTLRPQVLQLPDIVADVSSLLKRLLGEKVKLQVTHGRNLGAVRADPGQLEQVIVNLAVNARDAMPDGGTLSIQTYAVSAQQVRDLRLAVLPPADYTALRVSDTGTGIPLEMLSKIFEPFFTTKEMGKGTGLGLSTVYGIVKQSGGYIFADSDPGKGASFVVYLPIHIAVPGEAVEPSIKSAPPKRESWGTGIILLVEDEDMVRAVAERALTRQGYTVHTACDGEQGLEALASGQHFDLLISDVVMPNMDGPTMVAAARKDFPDLPVLFMSGYAEEQLRKSIDIENVGFLPKPFSVAQLAEAAQNALNTNAKA
jgi:two-component system, cell cycle sensor histidine kinase and response regulator CckA